MNKPALNIDAWTVTMRFCKFNEYGVILETLKIFFSKAAIFSYQIVFFYFFQIIIVFLKQLSYLNH